MFRTILRIAKTSANVLTSAAPMRVNSFDKLNVLSLLAQAAFALKRGNPKRALVFLGAASIAPRHKGLSYLVQGAVTANDVRKKLF